MVAALIIMVDRRLPRLAIDLLATAGALADVVFTALILHQSASGRVITWSAGWKPVHGLSVGIVLVDDPIGAGIALLAAALVVLALVFSWHYIESEEGHYHCLMLLFLAGMEGFALTGDIFDMFVFFELMGAAAYALTGMKIEDPTSVQGGMNFGIINSLGAYIALMGVGLLYAKTGQLGLPQLGRALAHQPRSELLVAAFVMLMAGFLVKGAMAPFHFWLADAHAVAPSPVCVLFSGVMVPLGVYGAFRVYWAAFPTAIARPDVSRAFLALGVVTAVVGAVMCLEQRNFKRLLAYSTIAHVGLFIVALGLLTSEGVAGAAIYIVSHAGVKAALFLMAGVLLARYGTVDEAELHGRCGDAGLLRWLMPVGGLALACLPPFGTALGKEISEDAGSAAGYLWVPALFVAVSACTGGAVLRVAGRMLFGLGPPPEEGAGQTSGDEEREGEPLRRIPATMAVPILTLLGGALAVGILPGVHAAAENAARIFVDSGGYRNQALFGTAARLPAVHEGGWSLSGVLLGLLSAGLALGVAAVGIWSRPITHHFPRLLDWGRRPLSVLRELHSGHVGDYVAWLMLGLAALGGLLSLPAR
ncbi:MAG TPA: complex I subunit 5 family protein [Acidimicrobiales bacterium]|jgi:multicomponent Na+:H+ antiporter subunit D